MNEKSGTEAELAQTRKNGSNYKSGKESNDFAVGLVMFILFKLYMAAGIYFSV